MKGSGISNGLVWMKPGINFGKDLGTAVPVPGLREGSLFFPEGELIDEKTETGNCCSI